MRPPSGFWLDGVVHHWATIHVILGEGEALRRLSTRLSKMMKSKKPEPGPWFNEDTWPHHPAARTLASEVCRIGFPVNRRDPQGAPLRPAVI